MAAIFFKSTWSWCEKYYSGAHHRIPGSSTNFGFTLLWCSCGMTSTTFVLIFPSSRGARYYKWATAPAMDKVFHRLEIYVGGGHYLESWFFDPILAKIRFSSFNLCIRNSTQVDLFQIQNLILKINEKPWWNFVFCSHHHFGVTSIQCSQIGLLLVTFFGKKAPDWIFDTIFCTFSFSIIVIGIFVDTIQWVYMDHTK